MANYRAEKEYGNMSTLTRFSITITIILTIMQLYGASYQLYFTPGAISEGKYWTLLTGFYDPVGSPVRYLFILIHFHRYLNELETDFFYDRTGALLKMLAFFAISSYSYCFAVDKAVLLGPIMRSALTVVYAHSRRNDLFRNLAGVELNYWKITRLPLVDIAFLAFLDFPQSLGPNSLIPSQLFGLFIGYAYVFITSKITKTDPTGYEEQRYADKLEYIYPAEFFIYLVIAIVNGGSFV